MLDEHRLTTGQAIWPGTGYIELAAEALAEHGLDGPFEIEDLTFLRPLHVADDASVTARVELSSDTGGYRFTVATERGAEGAMALVRHAEAQVRRLSGARPAPIDIDRVLSACRDKITASENGNALASAQSGNLRFGPRWQVLRSAAF